MLNGTLMTDTCLMHHLISQIHWSPPPWWGMRWPLHVCVRTQLPGATWPPCQNLWMMAEVSHRSYCTRHSIPKRQVQLKKFLDLCFFSIPFHCSAYCIFTKMCEWPLKVCQHYVFIVSVINENRSLNARTRPMVWAWDFAYLHSS